MNSEEHAALVRTEWDCKQISFVLFIFACVAIISLLHTQTSVELFFAIVAEILLGGGALFAVLKARKIRHRLSQH